MPVEYYVFKKSLYYSDIKLMYVMPADVSVYLSLGNPAGTVREDRGAMLVLVNLVGELDTTVTVTVRTDEGTGEDAFLMDHQFIINVYFQLWKVPTMFQ